FDELGGAPSGKEHRRLIDEQRPVKLAHHAARPLVVGANHDAIGALEVLNGRALAQKLRIRHYGEVRIGAQLADDGINLIVGSDRNRRLDHDDGKAVHFGRDLARGVMDVGEVGKTVAAPGRRPDGEKYRIRRANGSGGFGRKGKPAGFDVARNERVQTRLEDRDLSVLELPDLRCIPVDTGYDVPKIRKTGPGHEPDVASTNHRYSHEMLSAVLPLATFSTGSRTVLLRQYGSRDRRIRSLPSATNCKPTSFARGPPFCSFWLCPAKNGPVLCLIVSPEHYTYRPIHPDRRGQACGARAPCNVVRTGPGPRPGGDLARAALLCSPACPHSRNREAEAPAFRGTQSQPPP